MVALRGFGLLCAIAVGLAGGSAMADAEHAMYLGFSGGMNVPTTNAEARRDTQQTPEEIYEVFDYNLDHGYSLSGSIGAYIKQYRLEFQVAGQNNDIDSIESLGIDLNLGGDLDAMQYMANLLYDIPLSDRVTAFLGAGAGVAQVWVNVDDNALGLENQNGSSFAYQGILGIAWEIGPGVCITADYRVWTTTDIEMEDVEVEMPFFHMAQVGVRFSF